MDDHNVDLFYTFVKDNPQAVGLKYSTDHCWNEPESGTWTELSLNPDRPIPKEKRTAHELRLGAVTQGLYTIAVDWTFSVTGENIPPLDTRVWIKYSIGHRIFRVGGLMGCMTAVKRMFFSNYTRVRFEFTGNCISCN